MPPWHCPPRHVCSVLQSAPSVQEAPSGKLVGAHRLSTQVLGVQGVERKAQSLSVAHVVPVATSPISNPPSSVSSRASPPSAVTSLFSATSVPGKLFASSPLFASGSKTGTTVVSSPQALSVCRPAKIRSSGSVNFRILFSGSFFALGVGCGFLIHGVIWAPKQQFRAYHT